MRILLVGAGGVGTAFARIGALPPVEFQSARVGGRAPSYDADRPQGTVSPSPWLQQGSATLTAGAGEEEAETDLQHLVTALRGATAGERQRSPWLPPLPPIVPLAELTAPTDTLPYALSDHPDQQARGTVGLDLARGAALAVVGGPRTGRTSLLRTLVAAAAARHDPTDLHLYVLDCAGGGLLSLDAFPHCGAVCARHDVARGDRVLGRLTEELHRRQALLAGQGFSSVAEQRAQCAPADRLPWILLMVDGWDGFNQEYDAVDHGRPVDTLLRLAREGGAMGLRLVVTGDRQLLTGRAASAFPDKLLLRLPDRGDYLLANVPHRSVPDHLPEGRGLLPDGPVEVQVALPGTDPAGPQQVAALRALAAASAELTRDVDPARLPFQVRPLPEHLDAAACPLPTGRGPLWTLIGAAGDAATTVGVDLAADGPGFLIAGPPRSGRSNALATVAMSLLATGTRIALVLPRRSPLRWLQQQPGVVGVFGPGDGEAVRDAAAASPLVVLVDDVHTMTDAPIGDVLTEILAADDGRRAVVASGGSDELSITFRGLPMAVRASRAGLLLQPRGPDGDLLGARIPRMTSSRLPGRGLLVLGGEITPVQTALTNPGIGPTPATTDAGGSAGVVRPPRRQASGQIGGEALRLARL